MEFCFNGAIFVTGLEVGAKLNYGSALDSLKKQNFRVKNYTVCVIIIRYKFIMFYDLEFYDFFCMTFEIEHAKKGRGV